MPDPNLAKAVAEALHGVGTDPDTTTITSADLATTSLNLNGKHIANLYGIQAFTKLTKLDLGSNDITDVSPLGTGSLSKLRKLWLDQNHITDLMPLGNLYPQGNSGPAARLPALASLDATGQSIVKPDLLADPTQSLTLGPAKATYLYDTYFAVPSTDSNYGGRVPIPPATSPLTNVTWISSIGSIFNPRNWPTGHPSITNTSPAAGAGTMVWAQRKPGTYTFGFSLLGDPGLPANSNGVAMNFSGSFTQKVYKYTITFDPQNGQPVWTEHVGNKGTRPSPDPTRPGYQFMGWWTAPTGGSLWDFNDDLGESRTLYGQWAKIPTVTFHPGNGDPDTSVTLPTVGSTTASVMPATPSKPHQAFAGWFTAPSGGTLWSTGTPVNTDLDLYARWVPIRHTVTIDQNGGHGAPTSLTVNEGQPIGTLTTSKEGHHLTGWTDTATGNPWNTMSDPVLAPMTIKAKWEADQYTVRFANPDSNTTPPADQSVPFGSGPTYQSAPTAPNYPNEEPPAFDGWYTSGNHRWRFGVDTIGHDQVADPHIMVLTAHWTHRVKISYDLGQAAGDLSITAQTIDKDTTLNAPTPGAWSHGTFNGWYTD
ncbi:InlB B-repeat-containing protein, partial [Bifidobacterium aemilianum]